MTQINSGISSYLYESHTYTVNYNTRLSYSTTQADMIHHKKKRKVCLGCLGADP